jgi:hypothetical protein
MITILVSVAFIQTLALTLLGLFLMSWLPISLILLKDQTKDAADIFLIIVFSIVFIVGLYLLLLANHIITLKTIP